MLLGATGAFVAPRPRERLVARFVGASAPVGDAGQGVLLLVRPWNVASLDAGERVARDAATGSWLALSGHLFRDLASGHDGPSPHPASLLLARLLEKGVAGLGEIDGAFAFAWYDGRVRRLHLVRDRFGDEPLFYGLGPGGALFGSRTRDLVRSGLLDEGLCPHGLAAFLSFGFVPGEATLDAQIRRVPPGGDVVLDGTGNVLSTDRWARPFLSGDAAEDADPARLRALLESAIARRSASSRAGVLLSPAVGSRGICALARARALPPLPALDLTAMLRSEEEAVAIADAVGDMDVPASDAGLEVACWIAGGRAAGAFDLLVAGDGADEIFASHPSFAAQRRLAHLEAQRFARGPLRALGSLVRMLASPDEPARWRRASKELVPAAGTPPELGAFRWRVLLVPDEILALASVETARDLAPANPWKRVLEAADGCERPSDGLARDLAMSGLASAALGSERAVGLRRFGIEMRAPCHDFELAEYAARIASEGRLRRDGRGPGLLGETIPELGTAPAAAPPELLPAALLKRWLGGAGPLGARVAGLLDPAALRARGLFRPEPVQRLLREHRARRRDHTGRLWALAILELWLQARAAKDDAVRPVPVRTSGW